MTAKWDTNRISALLSSAFIPRRNTTKNVDAAPEATIDVLITFDRSGISGHPNHISLYHGARSFVASLTAGKPGWKPPVDLYTLRSVSILRKYTSCLDTVATLAAWALTTPMKNKEHPAGLVFLNGFGAGGMGTAWRAMTEAHKSQMVWFRYGWITLSRYMLINDLRLEDVHKKP